MGRPKSFHEEDTLRSAAQAFTVGGYEGTSVDDLVKALNLHRGSLYKAFGSKRGLFLAVLRQYVRSGLTAAVQAIHGDSSREVDLFAALARSSDLDLLLIAALERGHQDAEVAALVGRALGLLEDLLPEEQPPSAATAARPPPVQAIRLMGARIYERLLVDVDGPANSPNPLGKESDGTDQH